MSKLGSIKTTLTSVGQAISETADKAATAAGQTARSQLRARMGTPARTARSGAPASEAPSVRSGKLARLKALGSEQLHNLRRTASAAGAASLFQSGKAPARQGPVVPDLGGQEAAAKDRDSHRSAASYQAAPLGDDFTAAMFVQESSGPPTPVQPQRAETASSRPTVDPDSVSEVSSVFDHGSPATLSVSDLSDVSSRKSGAAGRAEQAASTAGRFAAPSQSSPSQPDAVRPRPVAAQAAMGFEEAWSWAVENGAHTKPVTAANLAALQEQLGAQSPSHGRVGSWLDATRSEPVTTANLAALQKDLGAPSPSQERIESWLKAPSSRKRTPGASDDELPDSAWVQQTTTRVEVPARQKPLTSANLAAQQEQLGTNAPNARVAAWQDSSAAVHVKPGWFTVLDFKTDPFNAGRLSDQFNAALSLLDMKATGLAEIAASNDAQIRKALADLARRFPPGHEQHHEIRHAIAEARQSYDLLRAHYARTYSSVQAEVERRKTMLYSLRLSPTTTWQNNLGIAPSPKPPKDFGPWFESALGKALSAGASRDKELRKLGRALDNYLAQAEAGLERQIDKATRGKDPDDHQFIKAFLEQQWARGMHDITAAKARLLAIA